MGFMTIRIHSETLGELLKIASAGKTQAQNCNFKCPSCRHSLGVEVTVRESQNLIIFKKNRVQKGIVSIKALGNREDGSNLQENDWVNSSDYPSPDEEHDDATEEPAEEYEEETEYNIFENEIMTETKVEHMDEDSDADLEADEQQVEIEVKPKIKRERISRNSEEYLKRTRPWECSVCHKTYTEKRVFNRHTKDSTECAKAEAIGHCMFCEEVFHETKRLTEHLNAQHNYRRQSARCIRCGKIFDSDNEKREHMLAEHFEKTGKRFQCRYCPKVFVRKFTVQIHEKSHSQFVPRTANDSDQGLYEDEENTLGVEEHLDDDESLDI